MALFLETYVEFFIVAQKSSNSNLGVRTLSLFKLIPVLFYQHLNVWQGPEVCFPLGQRPISSEIKFWHVEFAEQSCGNIFVFYKKPCKRFTWLTSRFPDDTERQYLCLKEPCSETFCNIWRCPVHIAQFCNLVSFYKYFPLIFSAVPYNDFTAWFYDCRFVFGKSWLFSMLSEVHYYDCAASLDLITAWLKNTQNKLT